MFMLTVAVHQGDEPAARRAQSNLRAIVGRTVIHHDHFGLS